MKLSKLHLSNLLTLLFCLNLCVCTLDASAETSIADTGPERLNSSSTSLPPEICDNGIDDDGDGLIDGYDPDCYSTPDCFVTGAEQDFTQMLPEIHCTALINEPAAYAAPVAADVDNDGDVEIIVLRADTDDLLIINGVDCSEEAVIPLPEGSIWTKFGSPALGDVDSDGYIDIFVTFGREDLPAIGDLDPQGISRIEFDGTSYLTIWTTNGAAISEKKHLDIFDLNQDGVPEIIPNGGFMVNSIDGSIYPGSLPAVDTGGKGLYAFSTDADPGNNGNEGNVELILGTSIYRYDFVALTWNLIRQIPTHTDIKWSVESKTSLADLDLDGDLDALVSGHGDPPFNTSGILAWDLQTNTILAERSAALDGMGRAAIGNFDDDPEPEFAYVVWGSIIAVDDIVNGNGNLPDFSNLWTNSDLESFDGSGHTQITIFDFDSDGKDELIHRGDFSLSIFRGDDDGFGNSDRIYNSGGTPATPASIKSGTGMEYVTIVDANGDGQGNLITIGEDNSTLGEGLHIFKSSGIPWANSRKIWNTQAYSHTNVNDDGTIPAYIQENRLIYNSYLKQHAEFNGLDANIEAASDITIALQTLHGNNGIIYDNCPDFGLAVELCNQGDVDINSNLSVEIYDGDPYTDASAVFIGTSSLSTPILISECITDTIFFTPNASTGYDFHFIVNHSDPSGVYPISASSVVRDHLECDYTNNFLDHVFSCNRPPVTVDDTAEACSELNILVDVLANDTDPDNNIDNSTLSIVSGPSNGTASISSNQISYTSGSGFSGSVTIEYSISDTGFPVHTTTGELVITVEGNSNPGTSETIEVCSSEAAFDLFTTLGGSPDAGGSWEDGDGNPHSNFFDPSFESTQIMTYSLNSGVICPATSATVTVNVTEASNAGLDGNYTFCDSQGAIPMTSLLSGTTNFGLPWYFSDGTPTGNGFFTPGSSPDDTYLYIVPGTGGCQNDTAFIQIQTEYALSPGSNSSLDLCEDSPNENLFSNLLGSPDIGGFWNDPNGDFHTGTLSPGLLLSGSYTYYQNGTTFCPETSANVEVSITELANPGQNNSVEVCDTDSSFGLIGALLGSPDPGGTWADPNGNPHSGIFEPSTDISGNYIYTIDMAAPCHAVSSFVNVTLFNSFDPGEDATVTLCDQGGPVLALSLLNGTPDANGTWTYNGSPITLNNLDPQNDPEGTYEYEVPANGGCPSLSSALNVSITSQAYAGLNTQVSICNTEVSVDLADQLAGTPDIGGTWYDLSNSVVAETFNVPNSGTYDFYYVVLGIAPCPSDTSYLTIEIQEQIYPGDDRLIQFCENNVSFDLNDSLSVGAFPGGNWYDPSNSLFNGLIDPSTINDGVYTYESLSPSSCPNLTAEFTLDVQQLPDAGFNGPNVSICEDAADFLLTDYLGGTPQLTGYWINPDGVTIDNAFDPTDQPAGTYEFHATSGNLCPETTSIVNLTIENVANPGINTDVTLCNNMGIIPLIDLLDGSPDPAGTWYLNDGTNTPLGFDDFDTAILTDGDYLYQHNNNLPCSPSSSVLTITVSEMTTAGDDNGLHSCEIDPEFDLANLLSGDASPNAYWENPNGETIATTTVIPGTDPEGDYLYLTNPNLGCPQDTAVITISTHPLPNAGEDGFLLVCSIADPVNLIEYLQGQPDTDGEWLDPEYNPTDPLFDPTNNTPGEYTYQVFGTAPCPTEAATASVNIVNAPYAGEDTLINICSSDGLLDLNTITHPDVSPFLMWVDEDDNAITPIEDPSDLNGAIYKLIAFGDAPCVNDTAIFTVQVNQPLEISQITEITLCDVGEIVNLPDYFDLANSTGYRFANSDHQTVSNQFNPSVNETGNYWLIADPIEPCPLDSIEFTITINSPANPGIDTLVNLCNTDPSVSVFNLIGGSPDNNGYFVWETDTLNTIDFDPSLYSGSQTIEYVAISPSPCPNQSSHIQIDIHQTPEPHFTIDQSQAELANPYYMFENETDGNYNYQWDFSGLDSAFSYNAEYTFPVDIAADYTICLQASNAIGCEATECETITVEDILSFYLPNSFTPDGDGTNDVFLVRGRGIDNTHFEMYVFSRNGDLVFESYDREVGWDGTWFGEEVPTDIYAYRIILKASDSTERKELMGHISLMR